jgi:hypothetical protein
MVDRITIPQFSTLQHFLPHCSTEDGDFAGKFRQSAHIETAFRTTNVPYETYCIIIFLNKT